MMDLDSNYEDMLEHLCGFCDKIFKKEVKLDKHIWEKHQPGTRHKGEEQELEMVDKEELLERGSPEKMEAKIKSLPQRYNNLYEFDAANMVLICGSCGSNFISDRGMAHHLNMTDCGFGDKTGYKPKLNYKSLYVTEGGQVTCCGCGSVYQSQRGMHYHLKLTTCGFGTKAKSAPKKDYTPFYKVENSIHICLMCGVNYDSSRGMHYHLQKKCGAQAKAKVFSPKPGPSEDGLKRSSPRENKDYKQFYRKTDDSTFTCLGCETVYHSSTGVHSHLNATKCGFGDKFRSPPKTCYLQLYKREGAQFVCLGCGKIYLSATGVHHHLNHTKCGFGEKENTAPRRSYAALYSKEEGFYKCKRCPFEVSYIGGIHRHIKTCQAGVGESLKTFVKEETRVENDYKKLVENAFDHEMKIMILVGNIQKR